MKNRFFIIIYLGLILSGCSTTWHIDKAREKCPDCFKTDTIINKSVIKQDTTIYLDTLINIILPRDTVKIEKQIPKYINPSFDRILQKQGIIYTEVEMKKGLLKINSYFDSTTWYNLNMEITLKEAKITHLTEVIVEKDIIIEKQISWIKWLKIALISIGVLIGLLFISGIIYKISKLF